MIDKFKIIKNGILNPLILGCLFICGNIFGQKEMRSLSEAEARWLSEAEVNKHKDQFSMLVPVGSAQGTPLRTQGTIQKTPQSPYQLKTRNEIFWLVGSFSVAGLGSDLLRRREPLTTDEILNLDPININSFDRFTTENYDLGIERFSDIMLYSSFVSVVPYIFDKKVRKDVVKLGVIYAEAAAITGGLTALSKYLSNRNRPFTYNPIVDLELKLEPNARYSFFSGHTSVSAMNTFFIAKIFSDYHPNSKYKPYVWAGAILIPAATGYGRVASGKHFPTDVLAGYAVGSLIGYFVPHFHKRKNQRDLGIHINSTPFGVSLNVDLN